MARPRRLNDATPQIVGENFLEQNPDKTIVGDSTGIVIAKHIPKMRKVVFINGRDPGYPLEFHYQSGKLPLKQYKLIHGYEHELPEEIIEHLEQCNEPVYSYRKGIDGHPEMFITSRKYLYQFRNPAKKAA